MCGTIATATMHVSTDQFRFAGQSGGETKRLRIFSTRFIPSSSTNPAENPSSPPTHIGKGQSCQCYGGGRKRDEGQTLCCECHNLVGHRTDWAQSKHQSEASALTDNTRATTAEGFQERIRHFGAWCSARDLRGRKNNVPKMRNHEKNTTQKYKTPKYETAKTAPIVRRRLGRPALLCNKMDPPDPLTCLLYTSPSPRD